MAYPQRKLTAPSPEVTIRQGLLSEGWGLENPLAHLCWKYEWFGIGQVTTAAVS